MNTIIRTLPQLHQAQADAWVYGLIVASVALAVAVAIAFLTPWRTDYRDYLTRRVWFIIIGLVAPAAYWLYNAQAVAPQIKNVGFRRMFEGTNLWVLIASIAVYYVAGVVLMFCFRNSKLGSILGKNKN